MTCGTCIFSLAAATHQGLSKANVFAHENRATIEDKFAQFQTEVCHKLLKNGVDTEEFRFFVTNLFPPGNCIPPPPANLIEMFKAITNHGLWDCLHYSPLVHIAQTFIAGDPEMKELVRIYKKDVKAYSIIANLGDYIEAYLEADLEVDLPPAIRTKNAPRYYDPVKLVESEQIDHTLQYFTEVWEMFSSHYLLPDSPPTALVDRIRKAAEVHYEKNTEVSTTFEELYVCLQNHTTQKLKLSEISCKMLSQQSLSISTCWLVANPCM